MQCMENCFWRWVQSRPDLPCLNPALLTKDVNLTERECQEPKNDSVLLEDLDKARDEFLNLTKLCACPKRCTRTDYHIAADPTPDCVKDDLSRKNGTAALYFSFPSNWVRSLLRLIGFPHFPLLSRIKYPTFDS